ncbi:MAG: hypothetical protein HND47_09610 [Chloroflexi bacterium]|nr:hypothetical protein [Chloroflexota bacterium]
MGANAAAVAVCATGSNAAAHVAAAWAVSAAMAESSPNTPAVPVARTWLLIASSVACLAVSLPLAPQASAKIMIVARRNINRYFCIALNHVLAFLQE